MLKLLSMCIAEFLVCLRVFVDELVIVSFPEIGACFEEILPTAEQQFQDLKMVHRLRSYGSAI